MAKLETITDRVARIFEERIAGGTWAVGQLLPTEAELAAEFSCSRGTVGKALERLGQLGLVERRTKVGTRVTAGRRQISPAVQPLQLDACAIVVPNEDHESIWAIVQGFRQSARDVDRRTVLLTTGTDFRKEAEIIGRLGEFDVKGALLYPVISSPRDELYFSQMILSCPYPVVLVDNSLPSVGRSSATVDNFHAGFTLTQSFIARGCKQIGFMATRSWSASARERYLGFQFAMEQADRSVDSSHVLLHPTMNVDFVNPTAEGAALARKLIQGAPALDALICSHSFLGLGAWEALQQPDLAGRKAIALGMIGGHKSVAENRLPITTYEIDFHQMGRVAFDLLQRSMEEPAGPPEEIRLRGSLRLGVPPARRAPRPA